MQQIKLVLTVIALLAFITIGLTTVTKTHEKLELQDIQLKSKQLELNELSDQYDQVLNEKIETEKQQEEHEQKIKRLEDEKKRLERDLQAKAAERQKVAKAAQAALGTSTVSAAGGCNTGNKYKDFIYYKESTCDPSALNSIGCRGLGQACPGSKLPCGDDFACQDKWFTNYAETRYNGWQGAMEFWLSHGWW